MSFLFPHLSKEYIHENYNAIGLLFGVPVHLTMDLNGTGVDDDVEIIQECNWVPRWMLYGAIFFSSLVASVQVRLGYDPRLPIFVFWVRD
jgi:hypothetical protein